MNIDNIIEAKGIERTFDLGASGKNRRRLEPHPFFLSALSLNARLCSESNE